MSKRRRNERRKQRRSSQPGSGNVNSRQMQQALNQMETTEVDDVIEVIVRTKTEDIILEDPEVTIMNVGQELWSVVPSRVSRRKPESTSPEKPPIDVEIKEEDVKLIVTTANVSEDEAIEALKKAGGDIAAAIMNLH
jgi:nascent polypeptide-associated complex subunit alpha